MTENVNALLSEWYDALVEVSRSFGNIQNGVFYQRAVERAAGLAEVTRRYGKHVELLEIPTYGNINAANGTLSSAGLPFEKKHAVENTQAAVRRLAAVSRDGMWLKTAAAPETGARRRFFQNLAQRHRGLVTFSETLHDALYEAYPVQMSATVPWSWSCPLLRQPKLLAPFATPQQALAVIKLHESGIPLEYALATLPLPKLDLHGALRVIEFYDEDIPAELASELV